MPGKHPANICLNKDGHNCHNCGGCGNEDYKKFPGYDYDFGGSCNCGGHDKVDEAAIAEIVKKVISGLK